MANNRVLLVDDEPGVRFMVRDFLDTNRYAVEEAATCDQALEVFRRTRPDVVILDYKLPDGTALDLIPRMRDIDRAVPIIVLTAHGSIDLAVRTIKEGAEQFLTKPVELPALLTVLKRTVENRRNRQRQLARKTRLQRETIDPFVGECPALRNLAIVARKVAGSDTPVLITGETGTGKGVLARWLHANGPRAEDPFVDLNCAGLSNELLDSELFGHERGAFTSAVKEKIGLLEVAHGGTLFLDEIGDMDLKVQSKLLKVLEEQQFRRLGGVRDRRVDMRLIAATHQNLGEFVRDSKFRSDLYFRINTIQLGVPPLRDRGEDIVRLARSLLKGLAVDLGKGEIRLRPHAERALERYGWPGNVRELRNVLERAVLLSEGDELGREDLHFEPDQAEVLLSDDRMSLREVEIHHITRVLKHFHGRVPLAAQRLGIPRSSLYQKLKTYELDPSRFRMADTPAG